MEVDKNLSVLIGNSLCASMIVAYAGNHKPDERKMAIEKWRNICNRFGIQVPYTIQFAKIEDLKI